MTDNLDIDAIEAAPWYYAEGHEGRVVELCQEVRRLRAAVALRPAITPEMARDGAVDARIEASNRRAYMQVYNALADHARKAKP